jgi:hypothetical protein
MLQNPADHGDSLVNSATDYIQTELNSDFEGGRVVKASLPKAFLIFTF